jgi:D-arginine dehydrogenase
VDDNRVHADVIVIGGGIAGASAAYEIASFTSVIVLEREAHAGYHSTGRSAASFTENYASTLIRRLAIASRAFLEAPPAGFSEHSLLSPRGLLTIARVDQLDKLAHDLDIGRQFVPNIRAIEAQEAIARVPILRKDYVCGAFFEPDSRDIDVHGLHQGFLKGARARAARVVVNADVLGIERRSDDWRVTTASGSFTARVLVNAAGAWADTVAGLAGVAPLGLVAKRRTAFVVPVPADVNPGAWPMVDDVAEEFYFKPDAGQLFVSPSDATPSAPIDVVPEDLDVAMGVERLERATTLNVTRVSRKWAGLRTFAHDGAPVVGAEPSVPGFFWLAGQGGFGIKTSPALSRACAVLLRGLPIPEDLTSLGITAAELAPQRLRATRGSF